jgi:hypothetical protein
MKLLELLAKFKVEVFSLFFTGEQNIGVHVQIIANCFRQIVRSSGVFFLGIVLKNSKAAKTAFVKLVGQTVQQEMKSVKHNLIPLSEKLSQQSINEFNWEKTLTNIELQLPVLSTAVYHSGNQIEETSTNYHLTSNVSLVGCTVCPTSLTKAVFAALLFFNTILNAV